MFRFLMFVVLAFPTTILADVVTIHDESFTPGTWDVEVVGGSRVSGATLTQEVGAGVTGNAQRTTISGSGTYTFDVVQFKTDRLWESRIDGEMINIKWEAWYRVANASEFAGFQLAARQSDTIYRAPSTYFEPALFTSSWQKRPGGANRFVSPTEFVKFSGSGPSRLDLSRNGDPIEFGYMLSRGIFRSGATRYRTSFFDLQIETIPIPEPSSVLVALSLSALVGCRRHRTAC